MVSFIISVAIFIVFLIVLIRWWIRLDSDSPDAYLLRDLRRTGTDPTAAHNIAFYLGFEMKGSATTVAEQLKQDGFKVDQLDADEDFPWLLAVHQTMVPTEHGLREFSERMIHIAESNKGEYGGWNAEPVPWIRKELFKVGLVILLMVLLGHLIVFTNSSIITLAFILLGFPLVILTLGDLAYACRTAPRAPRVASVIGFILGVPQALVALLTVGIGLSVFVWVLYNTFIETQPEYRGGFLTFGIAPLLLFVGITWIKRIFDKRKSDYE